MYWLWKFELCALVVFAKFSGCDEKIGVLDYLKKIGHGIRGGAGISDVCGRAVFAIMPEYEKKLECVLNVFAFVLSVLALDSDRWVKYY